MPQTPVAFRHYYARWLRCFGRDVLSSWKRYVVGGVLASAVLLLQIGYGVIPHNLTMPALKSVLWPYVLLLIALCLVSTVRAPILVERQLREELQEEAKRKAESDKRKRSPAEEFAYTKAVEALQSLPEGAALALRHLYNHERLTFGTYFPVLPKGIRGQELHALYEKCREAGLLGVERTPMGESTYWIAPGVKNAVAEIIFGPGT